MLTIGSNAPGWWFGVQTAKGINSVSLRVFFFGSSVELLYGKVMVPLSNLSSPMATLDRIFRSSMGMWI
jgi:hypothetical protein